MVQLSNELPSILIEISKETQCLDLACKYYSAFIKFVVKKDNIEEADIIPLLKFVIKNGDATVYQWKTGEVPSKIVERVQTINLETMAQITADGGDEAEEEVSERIELLMNNKPFQYLCIMEKSATVLLWLKGNHSCILK